MKNGLIAHLFAITLRHANYVAMSNHQYFFAFIFFLQVIQSGKNTLLQAVKGFNTARRFVMPIGKPLSFAKRAHFMIRPAFKFSNANLAQTFIGNHFYLQRLGDNLRGFLGPFKIRSNDYFEFFRL